MNREQAEKKARELLPKKDENLGNGRDCVCGAYGECECGGCGADWTDYSVYNKAISDCIPIVADLLMREADLEKNNKTLEEISMGDDCYISELRTDLSASQKRVEELEKENYLLKSQYTIEDGDKGFEDLKQENIELRMKHRVDNDILQKLKAERESLKQSQGKVLNFYELEKIAYDFINTSLHSKSKSMSIATAIHKVQKGE